MEEKSLVLEVAKDEVVSDRATKNNRNGNKSGSSRQTQSRSKRTRPQGPKKNDVEVIAKNEAVEADKIVEPTLPVCTWSEYYFPGETEEIVNECACRILSCAAVRQFFPECSPSRGNPDDCGCEEVVGALLRFATVRDACETGFPKHWLASTAVMQQVRIFADETDQQVFRFSEGMCFRVHEFVNIPVHMNQFRFVCAVFIFSSPVVYCIHRVYSSFDLSPESLLWHLSTKGRPSEDDTQAASYFLSFVCLLYALALLKVLYNALHYTSKTHFFEHTIVHTYSTRPSAPGPGEWPLSDLRNRSANFARDPMMPRYINIDYSTRLVQGRLYQNSLHNNGPRVFAPSGLVLPARPSFYVHPMGWLEHTLRDVFLVMEPVNIGFGNDGIISWRPFIPLGAGRASEQFTAQVWSGMASFTTRAHWQLLRHIEARVANNTHVNIDAMTGFFDQVHWNSLVLAVAYAYHCRQTAGLHDYRFVVEEGS